MASGRYSWARVLSIGFYEEPNVGLSKYRLHFNENLFLPREYYESILGVLMEPDLIRYYTEPLNPSLNELIAKHINANANNVFAVAGGDEGLRLLIQLTLHGSGRLLVIEPTYSMPRALAESMNIRIKEVTLKPSYELDVDEVIKVGGDVDVVYLCNPNNPTGNLFNRADVEYIASRLRALIIIDEAYADFAGVTLMDLTRHYDNVAVVRTFSKAWGLAGLRVGYVVGSEVIINALKRISLPHNIPYPSIAMLSKALQLKHYVEESIRRMIEVRGFMMRRMSEIGLRPLNSVANFITFHALRPNAVYEELFKRGFVLRNLSGKVLCEDCLRTT
ncbi:pyridoxal phosphate-dependent aminotransferase, partial [Caldivirga sp. UBA161]|uniref:pyridoxal phosphate-dependent aminotransferase n=1 Tax=Caldivirga sp. UBA161 TaxID=1915569 RepID=UPI0025C1EDB3